MLISFEYVGLERIKNAQTRDANWHPVLENQLSQELLVNCF